VFRVAEDNVRKQKIEGLLQLHKREVFVYVQTFGFDWFDAEDLTQEVFIRLWRTTTLDPETLPRYFIYRVARTVCIDHVRRNGRRKRDTGLTDSLDALSNGKGPYANGLPVDETSLLNILVERLPPLEREMITLVYGTGQSIEEAAVIIGIKSRRAKLLLERASGRLKKNRK
jgi:RNA polymerase sigma-70 factor (ECF subfamily)